MLEKRTSERRNPNRRYSLKGRVLILWGISVLFCAILITSQMYQYFKHIAENREQDMAIISSSYADKMNTDINNLMEQVDWYYASNYYYKLIATGGSLPEMDWIKSASRIKNNFETQAAALSIPAGYFFLDTEKNSMRSSYHQVGDGFGDGEAYRLDNAMKEYLGCMIGLTRDTSFITSDEKTYLVCSIGSKGRVVGFALNLMDYIAYEEGIELFYTYNDVIKAASGERLIEEEQFLKDVIKRKNKAETVVSSGNIYVSEQEVYAVNGLKFYLVRDYSHQEGISDIVVFWMRVILIPSVMLLFTFFYYRILQKSMFHPVQYLLERVQALKVSDQTEKNDLGDSIIEYHEINEKIDEMIQDLRSLEQEKVLESRRADDALLQYYQLQTDPHFYLNCMNTISVLLENGQIGVASDMLAALSAHFRYMFRGNRALVSLQEELTESMDYAKIYQIRNGFPILLTADIEENLKKNEVPILCVQTFVENSIKYYGKKGQMLSIRVQAHHVQNEDGSDAINLRISDNGVGYTEEALTELNQPVEKFEFKSNHVGIYNLKYRLFLIYKDRARLDFYNAPYGGAVAEMTISEVKHEHSDN